MLKKVFMAPDPGRIRLRFATRAVLGIGAAVVACGLAGHSLTGAITGGLAALLALFTVTDATVRGQAVTTALLPAVGLPPCWPPPPGPPGPPRGPGRGLPRRGRARRVRQALGSPADTPSASSPS